VDGHISKLPQSELLLSRLAGCKSINFDCMGFVMKKVGPKGVLLA
jgi:hypothetical protein